MQIRRKSFLALGGLAATTTLLAACGGSDSGGRFLRFHFTLFTGGGGIGALHFASRSPVVSEVG